MTEPVSPAEIARLFCDHAASLELYASQWTESADDCVQEAMIQLAAQKVRPPNPIAWLFLVVRNKSLNAARAQRRRNNHERLASLLVNSSRNDAAGEAEKQRLSVCLDQLSPSDRELIVLRIWSGLTWHQVAQLVGTSSSTAQRNYVAALAKLKQIMEPSCQKNLSSPMN